MIHAWLLLGQSRHGDNARQPTWRAKVQNIDAASRRQISPKSAPTAINDHDGHDLAILRRGYAPPADQETCTLPRQPNRTKMRFPIDPVEDEKLIVLRIVDQANGMPTDLLVEDLMEV